MSSRQAVIDTKDHTLAGWEIVSVVTSCLIAEWLVLAFAGNSKAVGAVPVALALSFMIFSHCERGETARDLGFRVDNFWAAARLLVLPTIVLAVLIVAISWWIRGGGFAFATLRPRFLAL